MTTRERERNDSRARLAGAGRVALAVLAGALLAEGARHVSFATPAEAQRSVQGGLLNPADQRNEMIKQLKALNERLGAMERALDEDFDVNVLSMPAGSGSGD